MWWSKGLMTVNVEMCLIHLPQTLLGVLTLMLQQMQTAILFMRILCQVIWACYLSTPAMHLKHVKVIQLQLGSSLSGWIRIAEKSWRESLADRRAMNRRVVSWKRPGQSEPYGGTVWQLIRTVTICDVGRCCSMVRHEHCGGGSRPRDAPRLVYETEMRFREILRNWRRSLEAETRRR